MKKTTPLLVLFMLLWTFRANATLCTAISDGAWSDPATWSCGRAPQDNDTMWIPIGFTVNVDINSPEYVSMQIIVDGNLFFDVGQKINMCPGSVYVSPTGSLGGGNPGSKLNICGETQWNGPDTISGPVSFGPVVLPVELISFSGVLNTSGHVVLSWATASETNNSHFIIERSSNGVTFTEIGRVAGHGTVSQQMDYSFSDISPEQGTNYYRLKQMDYNGHYDYSGIVAIDVLTNTVGCILSVFPNPCPGNCTVNFTDCPQDNNGYITLQMIDANGQIVSEQIPQRSTEGGFTAHIDTENNLKPGVYIVRGVSSNKSYALNAVLK
jgi:hypothetical protein